MHLSKLEGEFHKVALRKLFAQHLAYRRHSSTTNTMPTPQQQLLKPSLVSHVLLILCTYSWTYSELSFKAFPTTPAFSDSPAHPPCPIHASVKPVQKWCDSWWNEEEEEKMRKAAFSTFCGWQEAKAGNIHLPGRFSGTLPHFVRAEQHIQRPVLRVPAIPGHQLQIGKFQILSSSTSPWHSTKNYMPHQKV